MKNQVQNATNTYMIFIKDCALTVDNTTKTFVNSLGQESSEIVYFLHNLPVGECTTKRKLARGKTTAIVARKIDTPVQES
jgi:hypothetical protein